MDEHKKDLVFSRKVMEMITVANEYCLFIEESEKYEKARILIYLEKIIPLLLLKGSLLPDVEVSDETANQRFVTEEEWEHFFILIKQKLGKSDTFFCNETATDKECIKLSLSEQVMDIYQDLKDFVRLYEVNTMAARENAVASVKLLFEDHWGLRAIRAAYAIHTILYGGKPKNDLPGFMNN